MKHHVIQHGEAGNQVKMLEDKANFPSERLKLRTLQGQDILAAQG